MTTTSTDLVVIPTTGELIDLNNPAACATALDEIRQLEQALRDVKAALSDAVAVECARQGTKTLHLDGVTVEITGGTKIEWDIERLEHLKQLGLPDDRWNELVTIEQTYKVNAAQAKRIAAANAEYAHVIETSRRDIPIPFRVSVKR